MHDNTLKQSLRTQPAFRGTARLELLLSDQPADPVPASAVKPALDSVLDTKLNLGDRVFGEVEKHSFIALPGKGGHGGLTPQHRVCPHLVGAVRSCRAMVQSGHGLSSDQWVVSRWESASSTWFQQVWGPRACGQRTVNFSHLGAFSVCKAAQRSCDVNPRGESGPALRLHCCFSPCSSLVLGPPFPG